MTTALLVAIILAAFLAGRAHATTHRSTRATQPRVPETHQHVAMDVARARRACPIDHPLACRAALVHAYRVIAWQRAARWQAQARTVQAITRDAIAWAAAKYHVSAAAMTIVGNCESHLWPFATNGQYKGAWQLSARHREDPIFHVVPWQDAYAEASHVARYVRAHGYGEWQCMPTGGLRW